MFNKEQRKEVCKWLKLTNRLTWLAESIHNIQCKPHQVNALDLRYNAVDYGDNLLYKVNKFTLNTAKNRKDIEKMIENLSQAHTELFESQNSNKDIPPSPYILCCFCFGKGAPSEHRPHPPRPISPTLVVHPEDEKYLPRSHLQYEVHYWIKIGYRCADYKKTLESYTPPSNHKHKIYLKEEALIYASAIQKDLSEFRSEIANDLHNMMDRIETLTFAIKVLQQSVGDVDLKNVQQVIDSFNK
jgi:hypothetical protein